MTKTTEKSTSALSLSPNAFSKASVRLLFRTCTHLKIMNANINWFTIKTEHQSVRVSLFV